MAVTWLPVHDRLLYPLNYAYGSTYDASTYFFHIVYSILVITIFLAVGIMSLRFDFHSLIADKKLLILTGLGASFGILLLSQLDLAYVINCVIAGVSVVLIALYVPIHLLFWSQQFGWTTRKTALSEACCSVVLFEMIYALFLMFNVNSLTLAIVSPLVSAISGAFCPPIDPRNSNTEKLTLFRVSTVETSTLALIILSDATIVFFNQSAQLQADLPYRIFIHWGVMLMFAVISWLYLPKGRRTAAKTDSFILVALAYVGALLFTLFMSSEALNVSTVPLNCASAALISFAWLIVVHSSNRRRVSLVSAMALFFGIFVFLPRFAEACIMYDSNYLTVFAQSIDSLYVVVVVAFASICLLTATLLTAFRARATQTSSDKEESDRSGQQLSASAGANSGTAAPSTAKHEQELSERDMETARKASLHERALLSTKDEFGLSNRELEVARMAIGNKSARKIAEELFVSENTVYTHLKHIYRKTGVHSRQEFIDLVEKRSSE